MHTTFTTVSAPFLALELKQDMGPQQWPYQSEAIAFYSTAGQQLQLQLPSSDAWFNVEGRSTGRQYQKVLLCAGVSVRLSGPGSVVLIPE